MAYAERTDDNGSIRKICFFRVIRVAIPSHLTFVVVKKNYGSWFENDMVDVVCIVRSFFDRI
jgi:hypothetical protein